MRSVPAYLRSKIVLRRAEDRLGPQPQILCDAVHCVHDVVADLEVGERNRDAFLDGAQFDAFRRLPEDLTVAEHVQPQSREREARLDVSLVDEHDAAARHPGAVADERGRTGFAQMQAATRCVRR